MESVEMEEILKILIEDEELIKNWKGLADSLGLGIADCVSLKNLYKQSTTTATDFFSEILSRWRSVKGQGATVANLVETLEGLDFKGTAEKIEAAFNIANEDELPTNTIEHDVLKWKASIEEIRKNGKNGALSIELLHILSYFNPEGTDLELLKAIHRGTISVEEHDQSEEDYQEAFSLINEHSLFKCENEVISIHCLVQEVGRVNCSCRNLEESLLWKLVLSIDNILMNLKECDIPHVLSVWKYAFDYDEIVKEFSDFPYIVTIRLEELSLYREMLDFVNLSCRILSRILGDDDLETLQVESLAAKALSLNGKYDEALQKFTVVSERQKSVLGKEHPATLTTEAHMARVLYILDRFNKAQELCKHVLESDKKILGENPQDTIVTNTKGIMANILSKQGKFTDATEMYEEVLEWQKNELGEENLETLTTRHNIACCLFEQKKFSQAKEIFAEVLKLRLKMLGEEHSETLTTKYMFALTFDSLEESTRGLEMLKDVLLSRENVLGQEHPDTINTREEIDSISHRKISAQLATKADPPVRVSERIQTTLNSANEAEDLSFPLNTTGHEYGLTSLVTLDASVEQIRKNGETGTLAIELLNFISYFAADGIDFEFLKSIHRGRISPEEERDDDIYEKAVFLLTEYSLLKCEKKLIFIHWFVQEVTLTNCRASNLEESLLRQLVQSIGTLAIINKLKQRDMPHVLSVSNAVLNHDEIVRDFSKFPFNIILTLRDLSLYREMLDFANLSYRRLSQIVGEKHSETLRAKSEAAYALRWNGKYEEALEKLTVVHEEQRSAFGEEDPTTLSTGHNRACLLYRLERYDEALETFKRVLESTKKVFGENNRRTIATKGGMATVLSKQRKYRAAMELHEEVLEWQKTELREGHPETLTLRHNIAVCLYRQNEFVKARGIFEEILELALKVLGKEHSSTLDTKYLLAVTLHSIGESEEGLKMLKEVLDSREKVLGHKHPHTIKTRREIDRINRRTISAQPVTKTDSSVRVSGFPYHDSMEDPISLCAEGVMHLLDRFDQVFFYKRVLESEKRLFGEKHEETIRTKGSLATALASLGKNTEAMKLFEEVLEWQKTELGEEDPKTLETKKMMKEVLVSQEKVLLGHEDPFTIRAKEVIDRINRQTISAQRDRKTDSSVRVSVPTENTADVGSTFTGGGSSRSRGSTTAPPGTGASPNPFAELPGPNRETLDERVAEKGQGGQDQSGDEQQPPKKKYKFHHHHRPVRIVLRCPTDTSK